eukprot:gene34582-50972_t
MKGEVEREMVKGVVGERGVEDHAARRLRRGAAAAADG